jgi:hypothetical protein
MENLTLGCSQVRQCLSSSVELESSEELSFPSHLVSDDNPDIRIEYPVMALDRQEIP